MKGYNNNNNNLVPPDSGIPQADLMKLNIVEGKGARFGNNQI